MSKRIDLSLDVNIATHDDVSLIDGKFKNELNECLEDAINEFLHKKGINNECVHTIIVDDIDVYDE